MAETIESFVAKLQQEGVQAGQQAADKIKGDALAQAQQITTQAKAQAEKIIADANAEAQKILARSRSELELAARDVILKLRQSLEAILKAVLQAEVAKPLQDSQFLCKVLHDLAVAYAQADIERNETIVLNVAEKMHKDVCDWALKEIAARGREPSSHLDIKGTLKDAGFEYNLSGATIEVTTDSVTSALFDLVSPRLREVIRAAAGESN